MTPDDVYQLVADNRQVLLLSLGLCVLIALLVAAQVVAGFVFIARVDKHRGETNGLLAANKAVMDDVKTLLDIVRSAAKSTGRSNECTTTAVKDGVEEIKRTVALAAADVKENTTTAAAVAVQKAADVLTGGAKPGSGIDLGKLPHTIDVTIHNAPANDTRPGE